MLDVLFEYLPWMAIVILGFSHWAQVHKIHVHREVRDLSLGTYSMLLIGYGLVLSKAINDLMSGTSTWFYIVRQVACIIPISVVLWQIHKYKKAKWHDDDAPICTNCNKELEPDWKYCPYCSWINENE